MTSFNANTIILLSILGSGLVAGIFYAFSSFVMAALGRLTAEQGISAMQAINITVINFWFLGVFFGTALTSIALLVITYLNWSTTGAIFIVSGSVLYLVGCILVTMFFNVPLNNTLAAVTPDSAEGTNIWASYLSTWTFWNHVRTAASLAAAACFAMALGT